jgi:hypothetical protein
MNKLMSTHFLKTLFLLISIFIFTPGYCLEKHDVKITNLNFSIEIPGDWKLIIEENRASTKGPIPETIGVNFVKKTNASLVDNFDYYLSRLLAEEKFTIINRGNEIINGLKYRWVEYEMLNRGIIFHDYLYMTIYNKSLITVTLTSSHERFDQYSNILLIILRTIKMK